MDNVASLVNKDIISKLSDLLENAGHEILNIRRQGNYDLNVRKKEGAWDVVSAADYRVERTMGDFLHQYFPDHGINAEEGLLTDSKSEFNWIIDPIDGTANYISGMDLFGISLGLIMGSSPIFGIIYYPVLGKMLYAVKDCGAFLNGKSLPRILINKDLSDCLIVGEIEYGKEFIYSSVRPFCRNILMSGSFTGGTLWLVESKIAGLFHTGATRYDIAAASIIAQEVGCSVSGIFENNLDLNLKHIPIMMTHNNDIHQVLRELLRKNHESH